MEQKRDMNIEQNKSSIILQNRKKIQIDGIIEVISFNEQEIIVNTNLGLLNIKGENLKMNKLDVHNGNVSINGKINSCIYTSDEKNKKKDSLFFKLFK